MNNKITIVRAKTGPGPAEWRMTHDGKTGGPGNYPEVSIPATKAGNFEIKIASAQNVTFSDDPIWIQSGMAKPTKHVIDPQIGNIQGKGTTVLTFTDYNFGEAKTLTYQLNFKNADPLDPIIQNGGGGKPPRDPAMEYALYGFAALFVAALIGYLLLRNKRMKATADQAPINRTDNG
jgi:hypothetical protein